MEEIIKEIESKIEQYYEEISIEKTLKEGILYYKDTGKKVRPILVSCIIDDLGLNPKHAITFGAAIELAHTATLIHDDLPCMDDASLRRGRTTLHKHKSEAIAVLAGDSMLIDSINMVVSDTWYTSVEKEKLIKLLTSSIGGPGVMSGQSLDILNENKTKIKTDELNEIHYLKTAKLFEAVFMGAGIIGKLENDKLDTLLEIGKNIGVLFQIQDDYLDVFGQNTGKDIGIDQKNQKTTYVSLYGKAGCEQLMIDKLNDINGSLNRLNLRGKKTHQKINSMFIIK